MSVALAEPTTSAPRVTPESKDQVMARIAKVIEQIRPAVQADGGDLQLVDIDPAGVVHVRLHGSCVGCPSSTATLQGGVERWVLEEVPEATGVVCD